MANGDDPASGNPTSFNDAKKQKALVVKGFTRWLSLSRSTSFMGNCS